MVTMAHEVEIAYRREVLLRTMRAVGPGRKERRRRAAQRAAELAQLFPRTAAATAPAGRRARRTAPGAVVVPVPRAG